MLLRIDALAVSSVDLPARHFSAFPAVFVCDLVIMLCSNGYILSSIHDFPAPAGLMSQKCSCIAVSHVPVLKSRSMSRLHLPFDSPCRYMTQLVGERALQIFVTVNDFDAQLDLSFI